MAKGEKHEDWQEKVTYWQVPHNQVFVFKYNSLSVGGHVIRQTLVDFCRPVNFILTSGSDISNIQRVAACEVASVSAFYDRVPLHHTDVNRTHL